MTDREALIRVQNTPSTKKERYTTIVSAKDAEIARLRARIAELEVEVGSPDLEERVAIVNMLENMPKDDGFLSIPADEIIGAILARVEK